MSIYNEETLDKKVDRGNGIVLKIPSAEKTNFLTFGIVEIPPGKSTTEHSHDTGEEFMFVIEGDGRTIIDRKNHKIEKGNLIFIRSNQNHQIINVSNKYLKLLIGVSPPLNI